MRREYGSELPRVGVMCAAHSRFNEGHRDAATVDLERAYQAHAKRQARARLREKIAT